MEIGADFFLDYEKGDVIWTGKILLGIDILIFSY